MRGKDKSGFGRVGTAGITPAYAGKSHALTPSKNLRKDHPRLCGEKQPTVGQIRCIRGSPPPMRGKVESGYLNDDGTGITPAYAGKSERHQRQNQEYQDHPRLCGEKICNCGR